MAIAHRAFGSGELKITYIICKGYLIIQIIHYDNSDGRHLKEWNMPPKYSTESDVPYLKKKKKFFFC